MFQTMLNIFLNIFFNIKKIYINNSVKLNIFNSVKSNILFLIVLSFILILFKFNLCLILYFYFMSSLVLTYILGILSLIYLILKRKNNINKIKYLSIAVNPKDWEFIQFKDKLIKLYYSSIIILFIFFFKVNGFTYLVDFKFFFLFTLILIIYSILLSNTFILFIFNIYLEIKKYIQILSEIKFSYNKNNKFKSIIKFQSRNFSTSAFNSNNYENDPELKANRLELIKRKPEDKIKTLKAFKKAYGGGFLGYSHIYNFCNITQFTSYKNRLEYGTCKSNLEIKLKDYISIIPETETYSILPVLRWEYSGGGYRSLTI